MSRRRIHGVPTGEAVRVDRRHLERRAPTQKGMQGKSCRKSRAGWRQQVAATGPRMTADDIWAQLMASDIGSQRAAKLIHQYRVAEQTGRLVETKGRQTGSEDDHDQ